MKTTILILTWINRILMITFLIALLISVFENEFLLYPMYIAFVLGVYQVASFLISLFVIKKISHRKFKEQITYISIVILYFLVGYFITDTLDSRNDRVLTQIFLFAIPIMLSIFWTYILETIKKEL